MDPPPMAVDIVETSAGMSSISSSSSMTMPSNHHIHVNATSPSAIEVALATIMNSSLPPVTTTTTTTTTTTMEGGVLLPSTSLPGSEAMTAGGITVTDQVSLRMV